MTTLLRRGYSWGWSLLLLAGMIVLWALSLRHIDLDAMNDIGLLSVLPLTYFIAIVAVIVSFLLLLRDDKTHELVFALHIAALIVMIHIIPAILYGTLRYAWAWKHLGIVDYIMRTGSVNPAIKSLNAYHNWPGFFAVSALITEVAGQNSPMFLALWSEVGFNFLNFGALIVLFRALSDDKRLIWFGLLIFTLANWVGQDYYSPQAMAYFLYLVILGISLHWFRSTLNLNLPNLTAWPLVARGSRLVETLLQRARESTLMSVEPDPYVRAGMVGIIIAMSLTVIATHQLTPIILAGVILLLSLTRQVKFKGLPVIIIALTLLWVMFVAVLFFGNELSSIIGSYAHSSGDLIDLNTVSPGQRLVSVVGRAYSVGIWLIAFAGALRRLAAGSVDLAAAMLAFVPALMPLGNDYGGEILFRVYLFTLPSIAFLFAAFFYPSKQHGRQWLWTGAGILVGLVALVCFFFAYYGKERQYRFTPEEVEGMTYLYRFAPENSFLINGTWNYPSEFSRYEHFTNLTLTSESPDTLRVVLNDPAGVLAEWMGNPQYAASYLVITRSQIIMSDALGLLPPGEMKRLEDELLKSDLFTTFYENQDIVIFVLREDPGYAP